MKTDKEALKQSVVELAGLQIRIACNVAEEVHGKLKRAKMYGVEEYIDWHDGHPEEFEEFMQFMVNEVREVLEKVEQVAAYVKAYNQIK